MSHYLSLYYSLRQRRSLHCAATPAGLRLSGRIRREPIRQVQKGSFLNFILIQLINMLVLLFRILIYKFFISYTSNYEYVVFLRNLGIWQIIFYHWEEMHPGRYKICKHSMTKCSTVNVGSI